MGHGVDEEILQLLELGFGASGQLGRLADAVRKLTLLGFLGLLARCCRGNLGLFARGLSLKLPLIAPELLVWIRPRHRHPPVGGVHGMWHRSADIPRLGALTPSAQ